MNTLRQSLIIVLISSLLLSFGDKSRKKLVWSDDFNGSGVPDSTKWSYDLGVGKPDGWGNELQCYTNKSKNARIENGLLIIEAHKESIENKGYSSARLVSKRKR